MQELKRRGRRVLYGGGALTMAVSLAVVCFVLLRHPPRAHDRATLVWYTGALAMDVLAVIIFWVVLQRTVARYAPACPRCGVGATWRDRSGILESGRCPRCNAEFVR